MPIKAAANHNVGLWVKRLWLITAKTAAAWSWSSTILLNGKINKETKKQTKKSNIDQ